MNKPFRIEKCNNSLITIPGVSDEELYELSEAFKLFDVQNKGHLTAKELQACLKIFAPTKDKMITQTDK